RRAVDGAESEVRLELRSADSASRLNDGLRDTPHALWYTVSMSSEGERLLVQQIRQGDGRAWEHLIALYEGRLNAFVNRRLHDHAASEDVVQETFLGFLNRFRVAAQRWPP